MNEDEIYQGLISYADIISFLSNKDSSFSERVMKMIEDNKKMGRPTDNPKPYKIAVKLDQESKDVLDAYCKQETVSMMEAARRGIKRLEPDLKK